MRALPLAAARSGRWHVDLRGRKDKAKAIVDARDGRIVKLETKDK